MAITKFTISRKKWGRGKSGGWLRNKETSKQCCLGFFARAAGCKIKDITGIGSPSGLMFHAVSVMTPKVTESLRLLLNPDGNITSLAGELMRVNDTVSGPNAKDSSKEKAITRLFSKKGVKVSFIP
jgi:hypothetical protein